VTSSSLRGGAALISLPSVVLNCLCAVHPICITSFEWFGVPFSDLTLPIFPNLLSFTVLLAPQRFNRHPRCCRTCHFFSTLISTSSSASSSAKLSMEIGLVLVFELDFVKLPITNSGDERILSHDRLYLRTQKHEQMGGLA